MLVPGLENASLFNMTSGGSVECSQLYESLCQCAQEMLAKYDKKQETGTRLEIKIRAVKILLSALHDVQENLCATISSALKRHAEALQGYEHLLSTKGNNYELIKQTRRLRAHGEPPSSLLWYHELKNELLGPASFMNDKQKEAISVLAEKKGLTLKMLETLENFPFTFKVALALEKLHEANLLEPDLWAKVFEHKKPVRAAQAMSSLNRMALLKADLPGLYDEVFKHENPDFAATALEILNKADLLKPNLYAGVLKHESPIIAAMALVTLNKKDMLKPDLYTEVLQYEDPRIAADILARLKHQKLDTPDNCFSVLKHKQPGFVIAVFEILGESLCTPDNLYAVINHPYIAKLESGTRYLKMEKKLNQDSFETCLKETGSVARS